MIAAQAGEPMLAHKDYAQEFYLQKHMHPNSRTTTDKGRSP